MAPTKEKKKTNKKELYLVALHVLIGLVAAVLPIFIPLLIVALIFMYVFVYSRNDKNKLNVLLFISYITGIETLYRSAGESFLPYEVTKYVQIVFVLVNIFIARTFFNSFVGILLLMLMLRSLILFPADLYKYFVFNTLGLCCLGFLIAFTAYHKISFEDFTKILKAFLYPCISFVTLITVKTPEFSEIEFDLSANFETTGGFGTNQVATLLGAAICLIIIMLDKKMYIGNRIISFGLIIYFFLRALLSFSRGGIIGLLVSFVVSTFLFKKIKQQTFIKLGVILVVFAAGFIVINNLTDGVLLLRYQGETAGTLAGTKDKSAGALSSGRTNYAQVDLDMWYDNIFLGVGPGNSQFLRFKYGLHDEAAPHTEATRLLAENGIFGVFINILLVIWPIYIVSKTTDKDMKFIKSILFMFAYVTTYHSAMRTGLTPFFYALASMDIYTDNLIINKKTGIAENTDLLIAKQELH